MKELIQFDFNSNEVRVVMKGNEPWFVAADICRVLGLTQITNALRGLDSDELALTTIKGLSRGNDDANIINESGLYSLIFKSRKAEAKRFKKWVTNEVLPTIRKTGGYRLTGEPEDQLENNQGCRINLVESGGLLVSLDSFFNIEIKPVALGSSYLNVQNKEDVVSLIANTVPSKFVPDVMRACVKRMEQQKS